MKKFVSIIAISYLSLQEINSLKKMNKQANAVSGDAISGDAISIAAVKPAEPAPQPKPETVLQDHKFSEPVAGCEAVKRGFCNGNSFKEKKGECVSTKEYHKEAKSGKKWICTDSKANHLIDHLDKRHCNNRDYCDHADNCNDYCEEDSGCCNDHNSSCYDHEDLCDAKHTHRSKGDCYAPRDYYCDDNSYCDDGNYHDQCYDEGSNCNSCDNSFCDDDICYDGLGDEEFLNTANKDEKVTTSVPVVDKVLSVGPAAPILTTTGNSAPVTPIVATSGNATSGNAAAINGQATSGNATSGNAIAKNGQATSGNATSGNAMAKNGQATSGNATSGNAAAINGNAISGDATSGDAIASTTASK